MVKIGMIADTHGKHAQLVIPELDILIHAGDCTELGKDHEIEDFQNWIRSLHQVKHRIFIAGNHDYGYERKPKPGIFIPGTITDYNGENGSVHYLKDSSIEIMGLKIFGSPWSPFFCDWAFNGLEDRGSQGMSYPGGPGENAKPDADHPLLRDVYAKIPKDTNILVCHGPPRLGNLDVTREGLQVGSWELRKRIEQLDKLKIVISGHIHEGYGSTRLMDIFVYNVSSCNRDYKLVNPVTIIEL